MKFMRKCRYLTQDNVLLLSSILIIAVGQFASKTQSDVLVLFSLMMTGTISFILEKEYLFPFLFFLIAPNRLLTLGPLSAPTIVMIAGIMRNRLSIRKSLFAEFFFLEAFSLLTVFIDSPVILDAFKTIVVLLFIDSFSSNIDINRQYARCMKAAVYGCIVSFVFSILLDPSSFKENGRFAFSSSGQNVLGILCAVLAINLLVTIIQKSDDAKSEMILWLGGLLIIGFFTGSRSFLLAMGVGVSTVLLISFLRMDVRRIGKVVGICIALCSIAFILYTNSVFIRGYVDKFAYRMTKLSNVDVSNGRYDLWAQYIDVFLQNPKYLLFGNLNPQKYGIEYVAHNMIIEQIADFGIIGSIIIVIMYIDVFYSIMKVNDYSLMWRYLLPSAFALLSASMVSHTMLGIPQTMMLYLCFSGALILNTRS